MSRINTGKTRSQVKLKRLRSLKDIWVIVYPWKLLYMDDFVIMSHNFEYLKIQLQAWRTTLDTHKTKILDSSGVAQKPKRNVRRLCDLFQRSWCKLNTLPDLQLLDS